MTNQPSSRELDRALAELGSNLNWPAERDFASAVGDRLRIETRSDVLRRPSRRSTRSALRPVGFERSPWQLVAAAVVAALVLFSAVLAVSPGARKAVAEWFGLRGIEIRQTPGPPRAPTRALGEGLNLGRPVSIPEAERIAGFRLRIPVALGRPNAVFVRPLFVGNEVFLVYGSRPGLPESSAAGVGALLSEFRGDFDRASLRKIAEVTQITFVRVNGNPGFWIEGAHDVVYLNPEGNPVESTFRLAGSVLIWEQDGLTFRLESALTMKRALEIARTVR